MERVWIEKIEPFRVYVQVGSFVDVKGEEATLDKLQEFINGYDSLELRRWLNNTTIVFCDPDRPTIIFHKEGVDYYLNHDEGDYDTAPSWSEPEAVTRDALQEIVEISGIAGCLAIPVVREVAMQQALCNLGQQICDAATLKAFFVELIRRSKFTTYLMPSNHIEACIRYAVEQCWVDHDYNYGPVLDELIRWTQGKAYSYYMPLRVPEMQFDVQAVAYITMAMCLPVVKYKLEYPPSLDTKEVGIFWEVVRLLVLDLPAGVDVQLPLDFLRET